MVSPNRHPERVAIIGSGISGLSLALALAHPDNQGRFAVTLYEKEGRLGGHSRTITLKDGQQANNGTRKKNQWQEQDAQAVKVDTGFIVYNEQNYPQLTRLFRYLGVVSQESEMTFCYHQRSSNYHFMSKKFFLDWNHYFQPRHYALLIDIFFFQQRARQSWANLASDISLHDWLTSLRVSRDLRDRYLYPLGAAIWSMPIDKIHLYPARYFAQFFFNHGLFTIKQQPVWRTITGGSAVYVTAIANKISKWGVQIDYNSDLTSAVRGPDGWQLLFANRPAATVDRVIFACHSDQALAALRHSNHPAKPALTAIKYKNSTVITHRQPSFMPKKLSAYSCWNFYDDGQGATTVSYWMNKLQSLKAHDNFFCDPESQPSANTV